MPGDDTDGCMVWLEDIGWVPAQAWLEMLVEDDDTTQGPSYDQY